MIEPGERSAARWSLGPCTWCTVAASASCILKWVFMFIKFYIVFLCLKKSISVVANRGQHFYSAIWKGQMRPIHASPSCEIAGAIQMLPWSHKDRIFVISYLAHSLQGDPLTVNSYFAKFTKREDGFLSYACMLSSPGSPQFSQDTPGGLCMLSQFIMHPPQSSMVLVLLLLDRRSEVQDSLPKFGSQSSLLV